MISRSIRIISVCLFAACTGPSGTVETVPQPAVPDQKAPSRTPSRGRSGTWVLVPDNQPASYSAVTAMTLELKSDTGSIRDTLTLSTDFTLLITQHGEATTYRGTVDRLSYQTGARIGTPDPVLVLPASFTGHIEHESAILDSVSGPAGTTAFTCGIGSSSVFSVVQRNVIILPTTIATGMTWTDSATTPGCSGSIAVSVHSVRTYRVLGEVSYRGSPAIEVERADRITAAGEGTQGQHRVLVVSQGTGKARLYANPITGAIRGGDREQEAVVRITTSGRTQVFTQRVVEQTAVNER